MTNCFIPLPFSSGIVGHQNRPIPFSGFFSGIFRTPFPYARARLRFFVYFLNFSGFYT
jgi:hypothetical protein